MIPRMKKYAEKYTADDYRNILHISVGYKILSKALVADIAKKDAKMTQTCVTASSHTSNLAGVEKNI